MPDIVVSRHAGEQMALRGVTETEITRAIEEGEAAPAHSGRTAFRKNFPFRSQWKGRYYETKQVMPIVVQEGDTITVVTVYAFYFGEAR
jgi:hypothetical protein